MAIGGVFSFVYYIFLSHGIAVYFHLALNRGGMTSEPPNDWQGASFPSTPTGAPAVRAGHTAGLGLWERRRVGVRPPAASRVHRAHSPLLPTSEELLGRPAGRRECRPDALPWWAVCSLQALGRRARTNAPGGRALIGEERSCIGAERGRERDPVREVVSIFVLLLPDCGMTHPLQTSEAISDTRCYLA